MDKITYIIGAGASVDTIPTIDIFSRGIKDLHDKMLTHRMEITLRFPQTQNEFISDMFEKFLNDCKEFEDGTVLHKSVDKLAKRYYVTNQPEKLRRLKVIISLVVLYSTYTREVDSRYDTFFQEIIGSKYDEFNNDYHIVSWNYDFLFEKAYSIYSGTESLRKNQELLHVDNYGLAGNQKTGGFHLYKINGTTSFYSKNESKEVNVSDSMVFKTHADLLLSMIDLYSRSTWQYEEYECQVSFAFENKFNQDEGHIIEKALRNIEGSNIIILIGYSLPSVNKDVDRKIIKKLFSSAKVVFQSKESRQNLIEKWTDLDSRYYDSMFLEKNPSKFYVPTIDFSDV